MVAIHSYMKRNRFKVAGPRLAIGQPLYPKFFTKLYFP
jgi:hypothetical protein